MKANVYSIDGKKLKEVSLPNVFDTAFDPALIRRAVVASHSARIQPKGAMIGAGMWNSAVYIGIRDPPTMRKSINVGHARLPRFKNRRYLLAGRVGKVPQAVGGRTAHAPKAEHIQKEKINRKEKNLALKTAIAATANSALVKKRGHKFEEPMPMIIEDKFEEIKKTQEVMKILTALKLEKDVERAKNGKSVRPGKGKMRGRRYKRSKSLLIVAGKNSAIMKSARNIEGIDIVTARNLSAEHLAPGTLPGRLTLWTESAIKELEKRFE
ncbi:MAG: 50S ribosomal protein L4 [archaeon]|nr:50S ribosomal protein L4 [archaeon]